MPDCCPHLNLFLRKLKLFLCPKAALLLNLFYELEMLVTNPELYDDHLSQCNDIKKKIKEIHEMQTGM
jgi:hypothetical protein